MRNIEGKGGLTLSEANDAQLAIDVRDRFRKSGYSALAQLSCEVSNGMITLRGTVATYYLKQLAQPLVSSLGESVTVNNLIEVES